MPQFHVYDKNRLMKDAHMGEGTLSLREVFDQGRIDTRVPLNTRSGTHGAGEIWIAARKDEGAGAEMGTEKTGMRAATTTGATTGPTEICGAEYFTRVEDRPVIKERVTRVVEHRPLEKEYVVETKATGVEREEAGAVESAGTTERVVAQAEPKPACEI
jgi:leucyl-tRNA synthetase